MSKCEQDFTTNVKCLPIWNCVKMIYWNCKNQEALLSKVQQMETNFTNQMILHNIQTQC